MENINVADDRKKMEVSCEHGNRTSGSIQTGNSATTVAPCTHFLTYSIELPSQVTSTPQFM